MKYSTLIFCLYSICFSCQKKFLDHKPSDSLVVPESLADIQAILDNDKIMNGSGAYNLSGPNPAFLEVGADNFYIDDADFKVMPALVQNVYTWAKENVYAGTLNLADWYAPYKAILYSNIALDALSKIGINQDNEVLHKILRGSALFFRAFTFYQLSQAFAPVYDASRGTTELGIPLRLKSDISEPSYRATLQQTYEQIISDLLMAKDLLDTISAFKTRPSKVAVYGLLSRVYLSMQDYSKALLYADSCLHLYGNLMDYKTIQKSFISFQRFNPEVIYHSISTAQEMVYLFHFYYARVDSTLFASYDQDDLRKALFFVEVQPGKNGFVGSYDANVYPFMGIATDEIYLNRAECNARKGNIMLAMDDLNTLLKTRYDSSFTPLTASSPEEALSIILLERRKELIFRGVRWSDIRRLNKENANISLTRKINGQTYTLQPNENRWVWPIPDDVIKFNPGMQQNPR